MRIAQKYSILIKNKSTTSKIRRLLDWLININSILVQQKSLIKLIKREGIFVCFDFLLLKLRPLYCKIIEISSSSSFNYINY